MSLQGTHSGECFHMFREINFIYSRETESNDGNVFLFCKYCIIFISGNCVACITTDAGSSCKHWIKVYEEQRVALLYMSCICFVVLSWNSCCSNVHWTGEMLQKHNSISRDCLKGKNIIDWMLEQTWSGITVRKITITAPTAVSRIGWW